MNMVYLPYSDDVRQPEADTSFTGMAHPQADQHQVAVGEKMMAALSLPDFASSNIPNPTLQRHYQVTAPFCVGVVICCGQSCLKLSMTAKHFKLEMRHSDLERECKQGICSRHLINSGRPIYGCLIGASWAQLLLVSQLQR